MKSRICVFLAALAVAAMPAGAAPKIDVVASFSVLEDMVREVGGDRVTVSALVGADGDMHSYRPRPADVGRLAGADLLVVNGLGFEGWIARLVGASGFDGKLVTASAGIDPLRTARGERHGGGGHEHAHHGHDREHGHDRDHGHGDVDPHAWHDLANGAAYVRNIAAGLIGIDPDGAAAYRANAGRYLAEIGRLEAEVRRVVGELPPERRKVVTSHDAFGYFGAAYGLSFRAPVGTATKDEPSAAELAALIRQIRAERIAAAFLENVSDRRLIDSIVDETGARIGGVLFSDALSGPGGPAPTYLDMIRHNLRTLMTSLDG